MLTRVSRVLSAFVAVAAFCGVAQAEGDAWSKLKVGDWAQYKMMGAPGMETQQKWVVKEVSDSKVVYSVETIMNGAAVGAPTDMTYDKSAGAASMASVPTADMPGVKIEEVTVKVGDKDVKAKLITTDAAGQTSKTWYSDEVPFGTVKTEANGQVAMELVSFGSGS